MNLNTILGTFIVGIMLSVNPLQAESPTTELPEPTSTQLVDFYFKEDAPRMKEIFTCESGLRQFDDNGNVIMSPTRDFGLAQINEKTWDTKAKEMGLDYKGSIEDNVKLAKYIHDVSGHKAWVCNQLI